MRNSLLVVLVSLSLTALGQQKSIGLVFGASSSNIQTSSSIFEERKDLISFHSELNYQITFTNKMTFMSGLGYSRNGFRSDLGDLLLGDELASEQQGSNNFKNAEIRYLIDYISLPMYIGYKFGDKLTITPALGFTSSLLIKGQQDFNGHIQNDSDYIEPLNFSLNMGISLSYPASDKLRILLNSNYSQGLSNVYIKNFYGSEKVMHRSISVGIGLLYSLN